ncbi:uncharacterized protein [Venturia canescens]|uniref:uncharacterized protein n=1 Tax=Venturia canescens TaxID=32260 RepID=UPI001C9C9543|nr:uncharacterized protein LOC122413994 [Venturia canescens]
MNITRIILAFLYFVLVWTRVKSSNWVDHLTRYIAEDSGARQVAFLTNLMENETITSRTVNDIRKKLEKEITIRGINIEKDPDQTNDSPSNNDYEDSYGIGSGATLFLLVHGSSDTPPTPPSKRFVNAVANMATFHYNSKFLFLIVNEELTDSFEDLLEHAWTKKLLDFTVVEWVEPKEPRTLEPERYQLSPSIIHQFNPFAKKYTKCEWSESNILLFPKKLDNMHGYPLRIRAVDSEPFTIAKFNEFDEPIKVGGANMDLLYAIADRMNASLKFLPTKPIEERNKSINVQDWTYHLGELQQMDLHSYLSTRDISGKYGSLQTTSIRIAEFCAIVPVLSAPRSHTTTSHIYSFCFFSAIILIYWIVSRVLGLTSPVWNPLNIANILIGAFDARPSQKNVERILFVSLLTVSCIFSSSIYTALTNLSLEKTSEMEFDSIESLTRSGFTPIISLFDFNRTFYKPGNAMKNLMKKTHVDSGNMMLCPRRAAVEKNIICLMDKARAEVAISRSNSGGKKKLKIANIHFWSDNVAFLIGKRSPYRSKIDDIIRRMHRAGLIQKLYADAKITLTKNEHAEEDENKTEDKQSMISLHKHLLIIAITGYVTALLVFLIELVVHQMLKFKKSKNRSRVAFFTSASSSKRRRKNIP